MVPIRVDYSTVQALFTQNCPKLCLGAEILYCLHSRDLSKSSGDCLGKPKYLTPSQSVNDYMKCLSCLIITLHKRHASADVLLKFSTPCAHCYTGKPRTLPTPSSIQPTLQNILLLEHCIFKTSLPEIKNYLLRGKKERGIRAAAGCAFSQELVLGETRWDQSLKPWNVTHADARVLLPVLSFATRHTFWAFAHRNKSEVTDLFRSETEYQTENEMYKA